MFGLTSKSNKVEVLLDWAYEKSIKGIPGTDSAIELVESLPHTGQSNIALADTLISREVAKSAASGFISGLGGVTTMAVAMPANLAGVTFLQMRMIAGLAHIGDNDIKDNSVRSFILLCWTGSKAADILKSAGAKYASKKAGELVVKKFGEETLKKINEATIKAVSKKFSAKGIEKIGTNIPLVGSVIGASFDGVATGLLGKKAKDIFIVQPELEAKAEAEKNETEKLIKIELNKINLYINLIKADGRLDEREMDAIDSLIQGSELDDKEKNQFSVNLMKSGFLSIDYKLLQKESGAIPQILNNMVKLSKVDGHSDETEKEYIRETARKLDVDDSFIDSLLKTT